MQTYAAIDIGSNSCRLKIAQSKPGLNSTPNESAGRPLFWYSPTGISEVDGHEGKIGMSVLEQLAQGLLVGLGGSWSQVQEHDQGCSVLMST
jgi:hypothetical protein